LLTFSAQRKVVAIDAVQVDWAGEPPGLG
jgi:hypothetical protein